MWRGKKTNDPAAAIKRSPLMKGCFSFNKVGHFVLICDTRDRQVGSIRLLQLSQVVVLNVHKRQPQLLEKKIFSGKKKTSRKGIDL